MLIIKATLASSRTSYLLQEVRHDAIDVFDPVPYKDVTPSDIRAGS